MSGLTLVAVSLLQQTIPLTKPVASTTDPLSQIIAVRELSDGRVLVVDIKEKSVQLLDGKLQLIKPIGREGKGPGEYAMPVGLVPMPSDVTYLVDLMWQRFLPIEPDGSTGAPVAFTALAPSLVDCTT